MRKTVLLLATGGVVFYIIALLSTLHFARQPVFQTVVPKSGSSSMVLDVPADLRIPPDAAANLPVVSSDEQVVGQLAGVTESSDGRTKWILVETGGFLGLGSRLVRISARDITLDDDAIRISYSQRELEELPEIEKAR